MVAGFVCKNSGSASFLQALQTFLHALRGACRWMNGGMPLWPDGSGIPLSALQRLAKEQAGKAYPVAAFNQWMRSNGLSANEAAKALGLSRRTIIDYHTGAKPIPPVVGLACDGYNARLRQVA